MPFFVQSQWQRAALRILLRVFIREGIEEAIESHKRKETVPYGYLVIRNNHSYNVQVYINGNPQTIIEPNQNIAGYLPANQSYKIVATKEKREKIKFEKIIYLSNRQRVDVEVGERKTEINLRNTILSVSISPLLNTTYHVPQVSRPVNDFYEDNFQATLNDLGQNLSNGSNKLNLMMTLGFFGVKPWRLSSKIQQEVMISAAFENTVSKLYNNQNLYVATSNSLNEYALISSPTGLKMSNQNTLIGFNLRTNIRNWLFIDIQPSSRLLNKRTLIDVQNALGNSVVLTSTQIPSNEYNRPFPWQLDGRIGIGLKHLKLVGGYARQFNIYDAKSTQNYLLFYRSPNYVSAFNPVDVKNTNMYYLGIELSL